MLLVENEFADYMRLLRIMIKETQIQHQQTVIFYFVS